MVIDERVASRRHGDQRDDHSDQSAHTGQIKRSESVHDGRERHNNGREGAEHLANEPSVSVTPKRHCTDRDFLHIEAAGSEAVHGAPRISRDDRQDIRLPSAGVAFRLVRVEPTEIAKNWNVLESALIEAADGSRGRYSVEGILGQVFKADWQLWAVITGEHLQALLATELSVELSGNRSASISFAVGENPREWVHLIDELENWARSQGCSRLEIWARKGWAKMLQDYKLSHVLLEKHL
jgi:hypothetical protein